MTVGIRPIDDAQLRIRDLEIINRVLQIISTKLGTEDLLQAIVSQIGDELGCTHCTLFLPQVEAGETWLVPEVTHGVRSKQIMTRRFKVGGEPQEEGVAGWVFRTGESVALPNAKEDEHFAPAREEQAAPRSMLVAPVKIGDRPRGVISADQDAHGYFSESDRRLVDALAQHAGIAIERAVGLRLLQNVTARISATLDVEETLGMIIEGAMRLTGTDSGVIHLINKDKSAVIRSYEIPEDFGHLRPRFAEEKGMTWTIVSEGEMITVPDITVDDRVNPKMAKKGVKALIGTPLAIEGETIGALFLNDSRSREFTEYERDLLSNLAGQAAIAIQNAERYEMLQRINEIGRSLSAIQASREVLDGTLRQIANAAEELLGADTVDLYQYRADRDEFQLPPIRVGERRFPRLIPNRVLPDDVVVKITKNKERIYATDAQGDTTLAGKWETPREGWPTERFVIREEIVSSAGVPLMISEAGEEEVVGVLFTSYRRKRDFELDVELRERIEAFANQAAIAISNARLFTDAQSRIRDLEIVNEVAQIVSTELDTKTLFKTIVSEIADKLRCTHCTLFFPQEEKGELWLVPEETHGVRPEIRSRRFKVGDPEKEGLAGWVFRTGKSLALPNAKEDKRFAPARQKRDAPRSMLIVPVKVGDRTIGVISADQDEYDHFTEGDRRLVEAMARHAGIAIERVRERNLLRTLIDNLPDYIYAKDTESRFTLANTATARLVGRTKPDEILGKTDFDFFPKELAVRYRADEEEIMRSGQPLVSLEEPVIDHAGNEQWVLTSKVPLRDSHGNIVGLVGLNRDITERKQAKETLEERATQLERLQEVTTTISAEPSDLEKVLDLILENLGKIFQGASCAIRLYDSKPDQFKPLKATGVLEGLADRSPRRNGTSRYAVKTKAPRYLEGEALVGPQDGGPAVRQELVKKGVKAFAYLPLISKGDVIGILYVALVEAYRFSQNDKKILKLFADQAAIAIENARLFERIQELRVVELETLSQLGDDLAALVQAF